MDEKDYLETRPLAADVGDSDGDGESVESGRRRSEQHQSWQKRPRLSSLLMIAAVIIPSITTGFLGFYLGRVSRDLDRACAAYTTQYSPVLKDVKVQYAYTEFNGTFMKEDVYRRKGSPEVDAAWEALGVDYRAGVISVDEGLRSGLSPAHVQRAEKYGGGFFVNVEGLHHLHCLNLVRKALFYNYPYYKALGTHAFQNDDDIVQIHVSHCLDTLRQVLMCNADTGVLGQVWYNKKAPEAFPDFKTVHKCKNFDAIRQWAEPRQEPVPDGLPPDYMKWPRPDDVLDEMP